MDSEQKNNQLEELKKWFHEQLKLRDDEIERLKHENKTLINSLMKHNELKTPPTVKQNTDFFGKPYEKEFKEE